MKYTFSLFISTLLILSAPAYAQVQKINTIAGNGTYGFSGDGYDATGAELNGPLGVAVDATGNVYIEDFYNIRVRKVNTAGKISTIAGNGEGGNTGDGSIATNARVHPHGVAVDKNGNLYISDAIYGVVRKVNGSGIISTVAGTGTLGYSGDGGPATSAKLGSIHGIALDTAGNLYIADASSALVRKVNTAGIITTIAGRRSVSGGDTSGYYGDGLDATLALLDSPMAVAVDRIGNVFIADYKNDIVRKIDTTGMITLVAGMRGVFGGDSSGYYGDGSLGTMALLHRPIGIAVDTTGNLFIADCGNNVIRKLDTFGNITTAVGNGTAGFGGDLGFVNGANLFQPYGVAVDVYGSLYIADANNERIRKTYSTLAVNTVVANMEYDVYPNPFNDRISVSGLSNGDKVAVYDIVGRQISATWSVTTGGTQSFAIDNLPAGVYMLQVQNADGSKKNTMTLVKQ